MKSKDGVEAIDRKLQSMGLPHGIKVRDRLGLLAASDRSWEVTVDKILAALSAPSPHVAVRSLHMDIKRMLPEITESAARVPDKRPTGMSVSMPIDSKHVMTDNLWANAARIGSCDADTATFKKINADAAVLGSLTTSTIHIDTVTSANCSSKIVTAEVVHAPSSGVSLIKADRIALGDFTLCVRDGSLCLDRHVSSVPIGQIWDMICENELTLADDPLWSIADVIRKASDRHFNGPLSTHIRHGIRVSCDIVHPDYCRKFSSDFEQGVFAMVTYTPHEGVSRSDMLGRKQDMLLKVTGSLVPSHSGLRGSQASYFQSAVMLKTESDGDIVLLDKSVEYVEGIECRTFMHSLRSYTPEVPTSLKECADVLGYSSVVDGDWSTHPPLTESMCITFSQAACDVEQEEYANSHRNRSSTDFRKVMMGVDKGTTLLDVFVVRDDEKIHVGSIHTSTEFRLTALQNAIHFQWQRTQDVEAEAMKAAMQHG